jgi:hypothetical protein
MLVTEPKVHRFKPSRGNGFLRAINVHSTPSFRGEVKSCRKILWHVKITCKNYQKYFTRPNSFPSPISPARALLDESGVFLCQHP